MPTDGLASVRGWFSLAEVAAAAVNATKESATKAPLSYQTIMLYILIDIVLLCGAALFAGLTLALMGLDTLSLEIIASSGSEPSKTYASKVVPLRRLGNQLLCTLVLGNVMVNTLIAQVTDRFVSGWLGTLVSTAIITLGGEIIPQATMSSAALVVGASSAPVVKFFVFLFYPVCKPLSMLLDFAIGNDPGQVYDRTQLRHLILLHAKATIAEAREQEAERREREEEAQREADDRKKRPNAAPEDNLSGEPSSVVETSPTRSVGSHGVPLSLNETDARLMMGAMDLHEKTVLDAYTPLSEVFMLEASEKLTAATMDRIVHESHSRIPIYRGHDRSTIIGLLFAKDLLGVRVEEGTTVGMFIRFFPSGVGGGSVLKLDADTKLIDALKEFQKGRPHIAIVTQIVTTIGRLEDIGSGGQGSGVTMLGDPKYETVGIITLDDILQCLIQGDIMDEHDATGTTTMRAADGNVAGSAGGGVRVPGGKIGVAMNLLALFGAAGAQPNAASPAVMNPAAALHSIAIKRSVRRIDISDSLLTPAALMLSELIPALDEVGATTEDLLLFLKHRAVPTASPVSPPSRLPGPTFSHPTGNSDVVICEVRPPHDARSQPLSSKQNLYLYVASQPSSVFTLLISGNVEVFVGNAEDDGVEFELGAWQYLGISALKSLMGEEGSTQSPALLTKTAAQDSFIPDFSARVVSTAVVIQFTAAAVKHFMSDLQRRAASKTATA